MTCQHVPECARPRAQQFPKVMLVAIVSAGLHADIAAPRDGRTPGTAGTRGRETNIVFPDIMFFAEFNSPVG
jgi:hypothetical protein